MAKNSLHCLLQTALNIIFCYMFNVQASSLPDNFGFVSPNFSRQASLYTSHYEHNGMVWRDLTIVAVEMFNFQNNLQSFERQVSRMVFVLYDRFTHQAASDFTSSISKVHDDNVQFIYYQLLKADANFENELAEIVEILLGNRSTMNSVVMFLDNTTVILQLFYNVSFTETFNFTAIRHVTEWIIVTRNFQNLNPLIKWNTFVIDFISVVFKGDNKTISIAQKSRGENLSVKVKMLIDPVQKETSVQESHKTVKRYLNSLTGKNIVRKSGDLHLKSKKSVLSGLHIEVAIVSMEAQDFFLRGLNNKLSNYERFAVALLGCLATHLDFTYDIVVAGDGGYFGVVTDDKANGMTGQLARREVALSAMPMNPISNRKNFMDFVPVQIMYDVAYLVYRLPQQTDLLDMTYVRIVQPYFIYVHIAPVLLMFMFRAAVRLFRQSRQTPGCLPDKNCCWMSRQLVSVLGHPNWDTTDTSSWHSQRILLSSWHVFWFILCSAYSAYLVTSFVVKPQELAMRSFKDLNDNKNFKVGILGSLSATLLSIETSDTAQMEELWGTLEALDQLDPLTFSPNISVHAQRILAGGYAFIDGSALLLNKYDYFLPNYTDVRYYAITDLNFMYPSYIGIPTDVFYKEALLKTLRNFDENGTLNRLKHKHFNMNSSKLLDSGKISEEHKSVTLKRIGFLLFPTFGGILLSTISLIFENVFYRWMTKKSLQS